MSGKGYATIPELIRATMLMGFVADAVCSTSLMVFGELFAMTCEARIRNPSGAGVNVKDC